MRQVTDTNRIFQHQRMLSGLPTFVLTADCQCWWHSAKWKCNLWLVLFLMLTFTNWLQRHETYILYSYRVFLKRLIAKQMTALFKSNHINEPLLQKYTNTDNGEWELICPAALYHCVGSARLWLRRFLLLNTEQKKSPLLLQIWAKWLIPKRIKKRTDFQTGHIRQATLENTSGEWGVSFER